MSPAVEPLRPGISQLGAWPFQSEGQTPHVDQVAHLRGRQVHQRGIPPAPLYQTRLGAGPERLHLLFHLMNDFAPERFAKLEFPGQAHPALPLRLLSERWWPKDAATA